MNTLVNLAAPLGRLFLAFMFVAAGADKIFNYAGTQGYMESMGVPGALLPLVIITELVGGLVIILGWQTRIVAFLLAGFSILTAIIFHADFANQIQMTMFMKNISIAGGFLMLVANGAGAFSIDNRHKA